MKTLVYVGVPKKAYGVLPKKEEFVKDNGDLDRVAYLAACKDMEKHVPITQDEQEGPTMTFTAWKDGRPILELPFGRPTPVWDDNLARKLCGRTWYKDPEGLSAAVFSDAQKVRRKAIAYVPTTYRFVYDIAEVNDPKIHAVLEAQKSQDLDSRFVESVAIVEAFEAKSEAQKLARDAALKKLEEMKLDPETQIQLNEVRAKRFAEFAVVDPRSAARAERVVKFNDAIAAGKAEAPKPIEYERDKTTPPVKAPYVPPPPKGAALVFNEKMDVRD